MASLLMYHLQTDPNRHDIDAAIQALEESLFECGFKKA